MITIDAIRQAALVLELAGIREPLGVAPEIAHFLIVDRVPQATDLTLRQAVRAIAESRTSDMGTLDIPGLTRAINHQLEVNEMTEGAS